MKKKVLFVINTLGHAGAEMAMLELMKRFDSSQYEVSLYVLMAQGELVHRVPPQVKRRNSTYCEVSVLSRKGQYHMMGTVCRAAVRRANALRLLPYMAAGATEMLKKHRLQIDKLLWRLVSDGAEPQKEVYDLAIAYLEGGATYYVADHVQAKRKAAFVHIDYEQAGYTRKLDRACYLQFDRIFTVSDEVKSHFLCVYPECTENTNTLHNYIDQTGIVARASKPGGIADDFQGTRLLTVGRLTHQKAYEIAVDAMQCLRQRGVAVRWYVLGEGPERKMLERKIAKLGLQEDFLLLGAIENPYPYFSQTDIYVHATRFEGKSIAIQEAQTLGCAIIASDCSGNREQIQQGEDGILCALDAEAIADSVVRLMEQPTLRQSLQAAAKQKQMNHAEDIRLLLELL